MVASKKNNACKIAVFAFAYTLIAGLFIFTCMGQQADEVVEKKEDIPNWAQKEISVQGVSECSASSLSEDEKIDAEKKAKKAALNNLKKNVYAIKANPLKTIGETVQENLVLEEKVNQIVNTAKPVKTAFQSDGICIVEVKLDLKEIWCAMRGVEREKTE